MQSLPFCFPISTDSADHSIYISVHTHHSPWLLILLEPSSVTFWGTDMQYDASCFSLLSDTVSARRAQTWFSSGLHPTLWCTWVRCPQTTEWMDGFKRLMASFWTFYYTEQPRTSHLISLKTQFRILQNVDIWVCACTVSATSLFQLFG